MKLNKITVSILLAVLLLFTTALPAMAAGSGIDTSRSGSLNVRILETGSNPPVGVPGGKVEIYRLTSVVLDPYKGYFHSVSSTYNTVLDRTEVSELETMTAAEKDVLIDRIRTYISQEKLSSDAQAIPDAKGNASFDDLQLGLYLVVQTESAEKYSAIAPFLITIPQYIDGEPVYDVDAAPKVGTADPEPTPPPDNPPDNPTDNPSDPKLPQTGQLWWPVSVMAILGCVFCVIGVSLKRKKNHE